MSGAAQSAGRGHLGDAGDAAELAFERRRDRGGHGLRTRAGQAGGHVYGGEIHLRKRRNRKRRVSRGSRKSHADQQQSGRHGTLDEGS